MRRLLENTGVLSFFITFSAFWNYFQLNYVEVACLLVTYFCAYYLLGELKKINKHNEEKLKGGDHDDV